MNESRLPNSGGRISKQVIVAKLLTVLILHISLLENLCEGPHSTEQGLVGFKSGPVENLTISSNLRTEYVYAI